MDIVSYIIDFTDLKKDFYEEFKWQLINKCKHKQVCKKCNMYHYMRDFYINTPWTHKLSNLYATCNECRAKQCNLRLKSNIYSKYRMSTWSGALAVSKYKICASPNRIDQALTDLGQAPAVIIESIASCGDPTCSSAYCKICKCEIFFIDTKYIHNYRR